jgi:hypothetical protein
MGAKHAGSWEAVPPASETGEAERKRALFGGQGSNRTVEFQGKGEGVGVASCGPVDARPIYHFVTCCAAQGLSQQLGGLIPPGTAQSGQETPRLEGMAKAMGPAHWFFHEKDSDACACVRECVYWGSWGKEVSL